MKPLRLSQQTFLIVLVPVIFELGFVGWLYGSLSEIERQAEQAEEARLLATHLNKFLRTMLELVSKRKYDVDREIPIDRLMGIQNAENELKIILKMVQNKPKERKIVLEMEGLLRETGQLGDELGRATRNGDLVRAYDMRDRIRPMLHKIASNVQLLRRIEESLEESSPHMVSQRRELIKHVLVFGVSLNIILAIALALIVYRGLVLRLGILYDNSVAFKEGRPLSPSPGGDDEIGKLDAAFRDMVQSLVLARAAEKTEAERLTQVVQGLPLGLAIVDESGTITMANTTLEFMLLKAESEMIGKSITSFLEEEPTFEALLQKKEGWNAKRVDGRTFPTQVSATFIVTAEGMRGLILLVDISQRLEVERMKQQFVAVVSHELRTPLSSVDNFLDMVKEGIYGDLNASGLQSLSGVQAGVARLVKLTRDLMDVERLDAGSLQLDIAETKLADVFPQALSAVSAQSSKAGVDIKMPDTDLLVIADQERIVQVLINFLSNAIKFSPNGSKISVAVNTIEDGYAKVEVKDSGPGIAPEFQTRIFDRFQQVSIDDAKKRGGAGLGLAICKLIIEQHQGTIGVESEPGKGSTFWFTLPTIKQGANTRPVSTA